VTTAAEVAEVGPTDTSSVGGKPRNPWIAAVLAVFFGTTGLVYCGRLRRAVLWEIGVLFVLIAVGCLLLYLPHGRIAWIAMALLAVAYNLGLIVDTVRIARRRNRASRWYQRWWYYLGYLIATQLVLLGIVQISRTYWEQAFVIPTGSMDPTILAGDRILVDKLRYRSTPIHHGDVIVFWIDNRLTHFDPRSAPPGRLCHVKRVVGLPGDVIEFRDEKLLRNGEEIDEPYALFSPVPGFVDPRLTNTSSTVVGDDELFVVGDNRRESLDSRIFGCIPRKDVVGKVAIIYWSREAPMLEPVLPHVRMQPPPNSSRRIRWERFGQRVH
jgi:signal peptidase I